MMLRADMLRSGAVHNAELAAVAATYLAPAADHPLHPAYAGVAVLGARDGEVVARFAAGDAVRYRAPGDELPPAARIPARTDTIWDLASISKLFTTILVLRRAEDGRIGLDEPVARYVPEFAAGGKRAVTVRQLLNHTSGLPAERPFWRDHPTPAARLTAALTTPRTGDGSVVYSDIGLIALGVLVERTGRGGLAHAVREEITGPLGMRETGYNPAAHLRPRIAATEFQRHAGRGLVPGAVHDENAWALGGAAGHAGIFSTIGDLAILCQMLLNEGTYGGRRILRAPSVRMAVSDQGGGRGLGFELNQPRWMGAMASSVTFGHTGYTGTSLVCDPRTRSFLIVLSTRVHPSREWGSADPARRALARAFGGIAAYGKNRV